MTFGHLCRHTHTVGYAVRFDSDDLGAPQEVRRCDLADLSAPSITPEGYLRAQGFLSRSGVFEYSRADGTVGRELRSPDEVFDPDSLASFSLVPLTLGHPADLLTAETAKNHQVGSVGKPERAGTHVRADILITDATAIAQIKAGRNKVSCGYSCKITPRAGAYVDEAGAEHRFDSVQSHIRGNHVAIVTNGSPRAGASAFIRADSTDAIIQEPPSGKKEKTMKVTINGVEHDLPDATAAAIVAERTDAAKLKSELEKTMGILAAVEGARAKAEQAAEEAKRLDATGEAVTERVDLVLRSAAILGKPVADLARMDAAEIMAAVIAKEEPKLDLKGKSPDFVRGVFQALTAKRVDTAAEINKAVGGAADVRADAGEDPSWEAYKAMVKRQAEAWKAGAKS